MKPRLFSYVLMGLLAILIVGGGVAYVNFSRRLSGQANQLKKTLAEQQIIDDRITQLNNLRHQYQLVQPQVAQLEAALPHAKDQSQVVLQLNQLAQSAGMSLPGVTFSGNNSLPSATSETTPANGVLAMPVTVQLSGSYGQMQAFLASLEKLNRYTDVTSITVVANKPNSLSFTVNLNVYLKP